MTTLTYSERLTVTHCWCGVALAIPDNLYRQAIDHGQKVYCPLGHSFSWTETEADRLRKQLEAKEAALARARQQVAAERDLRTHTEHQLRGQKAATTRARKRHAAGTCPCCRRSFKQVRQHMARMHPDFDPEVSS